MVPNVLPPAPPSYATVQPAAVRSACNGGHKLGTLPSGALLTVASLVSGEHGRARLQYVAAVAAGGRPLGPEVPQSGWVSLQAESGKVLVVIAPPQVRSYIRCRVRPLSPF